MTKLEDLPNEVFGELAKLLGGWRIYKLAVLSGSRCLYHKLINSPTIVSLSCVYPDDTERKYLLGRESWPQFMGRFSSLFELIIESPSELRSYNYESIIQLPSSIKSLSLLFNNATKGFYSESANKFLTRMVSTKRNGRFYISVEKKFPNLAKFAIKGCSQDILPIFESLPVETLESLSMRKTTFYFESGSIILAALNRLSSLQHLDVDLDIPPGLLRTELQSSLKSFKLFAISESWPDLPERNFSRFFNLTELFLADPSGSSFDDTFPPNLVNLTLGVPKGNGWVARLPRTLTRFRSIVVLPMLEEEYLLFPHGLRELDIYTPVPVHDASWAPRGLQKLRLESPQKDSLKTFDLGTLPPTLMELSLMYDIRMDPSTLVKAPKTLTKIHLASCTIPGFTVDDLPLLPPNLIDLMALIDNLESVEDLHKLPKRNLTRLVLLNSWQIDDDQLLKLPRNLNFFGTSSIAFYGASLDRDARSVDTGNLGTSLSPSVSQHLIITPKTSLYTSFESHITALIGNPNYWPSSIKSLSWTCRSPPLHQVLWKTPSLTKLHSEYPIDSEHTDALPKSLTHLHVEGWWQTDLSQYTSLTSLTIPNVVLKKPDLLPPSLTFLKLGCLHSKHIDSLTQLKTLHMETNDEFCSHPWTHAPLSVYPPSLTELTVAFINTIIDTIFNGDSLPRNLKNYACSWDFNASTIDQLPPGLTSLRCRNIVVSDAVNFLRDFNAQVSSPSVTSSPRIPACDHPLLPYLPSYMNEYSTNPALELQDIAETIITSVAKIKRPQLQLSVRRKYCFNVSKTRELSDSSSSVENEPNIWSLLPRNITSLTFNSSINTLPELQKSDFSLFPSGLTQLDLSGYQMPHHFTKHLPRSLIYLAVDARLFNVQSYSELPRNLKSLHLRAKKWTAKRSVALPPSLISLYLNLSLAPSVDIRGIPSSIVTFRIKYRALEDRHLSQLPPNLIFFRSDSEFLSNRSISNLESTVEHCRVSSF